jgi:Molybdenum cofactor biosynthesis enzyme
MSENENILNRLTEDWNEIKEIAVYGFGRTAVRNIDKLAEDFHIGIIIDNNPAICGKEYAGCKIQTFEEAKESLPGRKIVIATSSVAYEEIAKQLRTIGLEENKDFCRLKDFMAEWYWNNRHQVCLSQTFSSVTSRCTFRCKYCNFFAPYFKDEEHYDYDENDILKDFEAYFKVVDYVASWSIIGGEPLINKHLPQIIKSVYEKFGKRIGYIQVISNGSLMPNQELLETMKECNVKMRLSDYTHMLPYKNKLDEVKKCLEDNGTPYDMSVYEQWFDLGTSTDELPLFSGSEVDTVKHMRLCATGCHQLNDKKFYFCGQGFARTKKGFCLLQEGDYIDLAKCTGTMEEKEMMLKFCMGFPPKGYISVCRTCYGMGSDNDRIVGVAEQM